MFLKTLLILLFCVVSSDAGVRCYGGKKETRDGKLIDNPVTPGDCPWDNACCSTAWYYGDYIGKRVVGAKLDCTDQCQKYECKEVKMNTADDKRVIHLCTCKGDFCFGDEAKAKAFIEENYKKSSRGQNAVVVLLLAFIVLMN